MRCVLGIRGAATVVVAVIALVFATQAQSYVYWSSGSADSLGRAGLDGSHANKSFVTGAAGPSGLALDGHYVYWVNSSSDSIGRANLDGTGADQSFIPNAGTPTAVAVDSAHVYWANGTTIGRANLNGTGADTAFITGLDTANGIAVYRGYIYWTDSTASSIGRARTDGSHFTKNFLPVGQSSPHGIAARGGYIYWANEGTGTIGRETVSGKDWEQSFIKGASAPTSVAVDNAYIYWANTGADAIGRADLSGHNVHQQWIRGVDHSAGVAADYLPASVAKCFTKLRPVARDIVTARAYVLKAKLTAAIQTGISLPTILADVKRALALEARAKAAVKAAKPACVGPGGPRIIRFLTSLFGKADRTVVKPLKALRSAILQAEADHRVFETFPWTPQINTADTNMARLASRASYVANGAGFPPTASP